MPKIVLVVTFMTRNMEWRFSKAMRGWKKTKINGKNSENVFEKLADQIISFANILWLLFLNILCKKTFRLWYD